MVSHDFAIVEEVCSRVDTNASVRRKPSLEVCAEKARLPAMVTHSSVRADFMDQECLLIPDLNLPVSQSA